MKISIITINLNNLLGLKKTFDSVFSQQSDVYEYIVIDGGSTDGSKEWVEINKDKISYWISEPDSGIYAAMNKGIKASSGDFLLFLNSGDWLSNDHIIIDVIKNLYEDDVICSCDILLSEDTGNLLYKMAPETISMIGFLEDFYLPHQSTFIRRSAFLKHGLYDEGYRFISDWTFFIKVLILNNEPYRRLPLTSTCFDVNGMSCQPHLHDTIMEERIHFLETLYPKILVKDLLDYIENKKKISPKRYELLRVIEKKRIPRGLLKIFMQAIVSIFRLR